QDVLEGAGFDAYEVSNHARGAGARSRHNLIYWRGGDYLGVGPGAHGRVTTGGARWATLTPKRVGDYIAGVRSSGRGPAERTRLTALEAAQERLLMGLRTVEGVALAELAALAIDPESIRALREAGLIETPPDRLVATAAGRTVLDRIIVELARGAG
ncbi:MAG TPA: coproporphyrinogen III oxidase, partial [Caulobacteraceae bacterium]|nr:coproporphyrinogen III oxidase [Caulobacteraceae bacterium]